MTIVEGIFLLIIIVLTILLIRKDQKPYTCKVCGCTVNIPVGKAETLYYCPECKVETYHTRQ